MTELNHFAAAVRDLWSAGVRRMPSPYAEPPYDERAPGPPDPGTETAPVTQGTLALSFDVPLPLASSPPRSPLRPAAPAHPQAGRRRGLRLVPPQRHDDPAPGGLPELQPWAHLFAQALAETLSGERPVAQLVTWTSEKVYGQLASRLAAGPVWGVRSGVGGREHEGRTADGARGRPAGGIRIRGSGAAGAGRVREDVAAARSGARLRPRVQRIRICRLSARVAEVTVTAHDGVRLRAAALRLEAPRQRWLCTVLELDG